MINCIIVDDEPKAIDVIKRYVDTFKFLHLVGEYREPLKALEQIKNIEVELIFLDINMSKLSGLDFKKKIDKNIMVIFTTAYSEFAIESYNLDAIDYLLKPITFERFTKAINKVYDLHSIKEKQTIVTENDSKIVFIKSGPQLHQVKLNEILFLEKDSNYLIVHFKDKKIVIRENMIDVFNIIPKIGFIRLHKSYVVALRHIETIETDLVIINKVKIPIGITYKEMFFRKIEELKKS